MLKKTELRDAVLDWVMQLPTGTVFGYPEVYNFLEDTLPCECSERGEAAREPRYKNDARWAVGEDALKREKTIVRFARGQYRRI